MQRGDFERYVFTHDTSWDHWLDLVLQHHYEAGYMFQALYKTLVPNDKPWTVWHMDINHALPKSISIGTRDCVYMFTLKSCPGMLMYVDHDGSVNSYEEWNNSTRWPWTHRAKPPPGVMSQLPPDIWAKILSYFAVDHQIHIARLPVCKAWLETFEHSRMPWNNMLASIQTMCHEWITCVKGRTALITLHRMSRTRDDCDCPRHRDNGPHAFFPAMIAKFYTYVKLYLPSTCVTDIQNVSSSRLSRDNELRYHVSKNVVFSYTGSDWVDWIRFDFIDKSLTMPFNILFKPLDNDDDDDDGGGNKYDVYYHTVDSRIPLIRNEIARQLQQDTTTNA